MIFNTVANKPTYLYELTYFSKKSEIMWRILKAKQYNTVLKKIKINKKNNETKIFLAAQHYYFSAHCIVALSACGQEEAGVKSLTLELI